MSRKLRWVMIGSLIIVLAGFVLSWRRPPDPLLPLSRYIVSDKTLYYDVATSRANSVVPNIPATSERYVDLKGISQEDLLQFLKAYANPAKGWIDPEVLTDENNFLFSTLRGPDNFEAVTAAKGWYQLDGGYYLDRNDGSYSILIRKPLSAVDVIILRLRYLGRSPFQPTR